MKLTKEFCVSLLFSIILIAISFISLNFILDPFQIYHPSFFVKDRYLPNERYQNAGIINQFWAKDCCDTIILGTSMSQNFLGPYVQNKFGGKGALNLAMSGATPREMEILFKAVIATVKKPKLVVWETHGAYTSADLSVLNAASDLKRRPDAYFPEFLYDDNILNDLQYLASNDILKNAKELIGNDSESFANVQSWYDNDKKLFNHGKKIFEKHPERYEKFLTGEISQFPNIKEILIPLIRSYPDIQFIVFVPPVSTLYFASRSNELFNLNMRMRQYLAKSLNPYKNARIYAFEPLLPELEDMNNFKDLKHYNLAISEKMIGLMAQGKGLLTTGNINEYVIKTTSIINSYIHTHPGKMIVEAKP